MNCQCLPRLLCALVLYGATWAHAGEPSAWQWGGSLRSMNLSGAEAPEKISPAYRVSSTRLRLETAWQPLPGWRLEAAADQQLLGTDPAGIVPLQRNGVNRRLDLDHSWQLDPGWASRLQLDRLNLAWSSERLDVTLGRQAIGFGRIATYSPLDIIAPFPVDAIDTEFRPGVDAARATVHYGLDGQLGAVAVFGETTRHNSYLLTWADNHGGIDLLAMSGVLRHRPMLGLGAAGSIGSLGLKGEAALFKGDRGGEINGDRHRYMLIAAVESWYRFDNGLTLIAEYLHNGTGSREPASYPAAAQSAPLREGLSSLLGRHYLLLAPSLELHPLATLSGLLIWNLADNSWLLRPTLSISLADNLGLELFWTHPEGESPRQRDFSLPFETRSEFGGQGENVGVFMRWFF